jgi:hypothetical protein
MKTMAINLGVTLALLIGFGMGEVNAQYTGTGSNNNSEYVEGYTRDDGTVVEGYYRTEPNDYNLDNYSAEGNFNPYNGEVGDKTYESPYNSSFNDDADFNSIDYGSDTYNYNSVYD